MLGTVASRICSSRSKVRRWGQGAGGMNLGVAQKDKTMRYSGPCFAVLLQGAKRSRRSVHPRFALSRAPLSAGLLEGPLRASGVIGDAPRVQGILDTRHTMDRNVSCRNPFCGGAAVYWLEGGMAHCLMFLWSFLCSVWEIQTRFII